jgi:hypothetical protein
LPDLNEDELDRFDEAFVPIDYATGAFLIDDDVADMLGPLPDGALLTLFMDCCHSGTNSRFAPMFRPHVTRDERVRYLPATQEMTEAHLAFRSALGAPPGRAAESSLRGVIHFAACQDDEFAWESGGQGDFTAAATRLLAQAVQRGDTNEAFLDAVRADVVLKARQHPLMMTPPAGLEARPLLVTVAGGSAPAAGSSVGPGAAAVAPARAPAAGSTDAALLAHLEAMQAILRTRTDRG